ncbi:MAG: RNA polymerase sigma factor [Planctomycetaceae bacterium]
MPFTEIDQKLLKRCLAQEPGAWKEFIDRYVGLFVHIVQHAAHLRSIRISPDDTDDLCAEIFLALLADDCAVLRNFRGKSSLAWYLTVVARRIVVREMAQRRVAETFGHVHAHQAALERAHIGAGGNDDQRRIDNQEQVGRMLQGLSADDAEIVRQFHLEGKSYREISSHMGIPENSIGPILTRAREKLRAQNGNGRSA